MSVERYAEIVLSLDDEESRMVVLEPGEFVWGKKPSEVFRPDEIVTRIQIEGLPDGEGEYLSRAAVHFAMDPNGNMVIKKVFRGKEEPDVNVRKRNESGGFEEIGRDLEIGEMFPLTWEEECCVIIKVRQNAIALWVQKPANLLGPWMTRVCRVRTGVVDPNLCLW